MPKWNGKWSGGRTSLQKDGTTIYWIRRMVQGTPYEIALPGVESERKAVLQLAIFQADPSHYTPPGAPKATGVPIDDAAISRYVLHMEELERHVRYIDHTKKLLLQWSTELPTTDLTRVTPMQALKTLSEWKTAKRKRIAALKSFCAYLIKKGELDPNQDPSRALHQEPAEPEKNRRAKTSSPKFYDIATVEAVYKNCDVQVIRDLVRIHATTGCHQSEIFRIGKGGEDVELAAVKHPIIKGTVRFIHKSRKPHVLSLDEKTYAAVKRIHGKTLPTEGAITWQLGVATQKARLGARFPRGKKRPGYLRLGTIRHSWTTWAVASGTVVKFKKGGVDEATVANILGHSGTSTMKKFYLTVQVPPLIQVPITLVHPDDP